MTEFIDVIGVHVSVVNLYEACRSIENWIQEKRRTYVCVAPVSTIVDCYKDRRYREIINQAGMTTPDGMPLVWLGKWRGKREIMRTYGPELLLKFCEMSQNKNFKHYFYGGSKNTSKLLLSSLKQIFPKLNVVGTFAPSQMKIDEYEKKDVLKEINDVNPDILWVGLGSPKQDYWMSNHRSYLNVPVMIGVGAAFDFIAGTKPQAPHWMRNVGLEWFFRLCCEPKRLWKRYVIGNPIFIYLLFKNWLRYKFHKKS